MNELREGIDRINEALAIKVDLNGHTISEELEHRLGLLAHSSKLMYLAKKLHGEAKGKVFEEAMNNKDLMNSKIDFQRLYIAGKMAESDALYEETESAVKNLEKNIEGLRSLLGFEKNLMSKQG